MTRGRVIWICGLSGAGKTTLARGVIERLRSGNEHAVLLDGDSFRAAFAPDLAYEPADRREVARRLTAASAFLAAQGATVVVATISLDRAVFERNRVALPAYVEVYLRADVEFLQRRDPRGLYALAAAGEPVVGAGLPFDEPTAADVVIDAALEPDVESMVDEVLAAAATLTNPPEIEAR